MPMEPKKFSTAKISGKSSRDYSGYVYNVTTETGNLFVENVLVKNSGGLGTPAHLRAPPTLLMKQFSI